MQGENGMVNSGLLLKAIRNVIAWAAAGGSFPEKIAPEELRKRIDRGDLRRVLVVRPNQRLGDTLLATSALNQLHERFPALEVHWLASPYTAGALQGHPGLFRLWRWNKKDGLLSQWRLWRALRRERFPLAIVLFSHTPSLTGFLIARACGARILYAFDSTSGYGGNNWSRRLAHTEIPLPPDEMNEADKFAALVRPLTGSCAPAAPSYYPSRDDERWAADTWASLTGRSSRPAVVLFPGGTPGRTDRLWPTEAWVALARRLAGHREFGLVVLGAPPAQPGRPESAEAVLIRRFMETSGLQIPFIEGPPLGRTAALLRHAALFVTTDGGLMHLACAAQVPTLALFFSTAATRWVPPVAWASGIEAPGSHPGSLMPEVVFETVLKRLEPTAVETV